MKRLAILALAFLCISGLANATIIAVLNSGPTPVSGGNFAFNYRADLSGDERLDPNATNGVTCPAPGPALAQCNPAGTFFTIYDINGFQSVNVTAPNWFSTVQLTGVTPSSVNGSTIDQPNVVNVTFFYTGPVVHAGGATLNITGFQVISSLGGVNSNGNFSSQSTKDVGDSSGNTDQTVGPVSVPAGTVPEPSSMLLIGGGLVGLAMVRRRLARS